MKIKRIAPLLATSLLLIGCSNSGVKTLKKPSFAKYSSEVEAATFLEALDEKVFGSAFFTKKDDGDHLIKGYTLGIKEYKEQNITATNGSNVKGTAKVQEYTEAVEKQDLTNKRINSKSIHQQGHKHNKVYPYFQIGEDEEILYALGVHMDGSSSDTLSKAEEEVQTEVDASGKVVTINPGIKQYVEVGSLGMDYDLAAAYQLHSEVYSQINSAFEGISSIIDLKYYVDGEVLTVAGSKEFNGKSTIVVDDDLTSRGTANFTGQIDYAKLTMKYAYEYSFEQLYDGVTTKVEFKEYRTLDLQDKAPTVKAIDYSTFEKISF